MAYEIFVNDIAGDAIASRLYRNGERYLDFVRDKGKFVVPEALAGLKLAQMGDWIDSLPPAEAEATRVLRWASMVAGGRSIRMPTGMKAADIGMVGTCHTFQPDRIDEARRRPGASVDFSGGGEGPLADRAELFVRLPPD